MMTTSLFQPFASLRSGSPVCTAQVAEILGRCVAPGDMVGLVGQLGAGKTHFAQGVARGLGVDDPVTSPTFTLINEYVGRVGFVHMDLYRLGDVEEAHVLGIPEILADDRVCLVEWFDRFAELWPRDALLVELAAVDDETRTITVHASGVRAFHLAEQWLETAKP